jgi:hypothetical protein
MAFSGGNVLGAAPAGATRAPLTIAVCANLSPAQCGEFDSSTSLASSVNFSRFGQAVRFTATVTGILPPPVPAIVPPTPTGTVAFSDGATILCGAATLDGSGKATCTKHSLVVGTHTITAVYSGDQLYNSSQDTLDQIVKRAGTHTIIGSSDEISHKGQPVTFSAFVFTPSPGGGIPTGKFQFGIDGVKFGAPVTIGADGRAFLPPDANLTVGQHRIGGTYLGDANHRTSRPVRLFQLVVN